jgi:hypothetical protein
MIHLTFENGIVLTMMGLTTTAVILFSNFYLCDNHRSKAYIQAQKVGEPGSQEYTIVLLEGLLADGVWPISFLGALMWTPLTLWFLEIPIKVHPFMILFFTTFSGSYFMWNFVIHHHVKIIVRSVTTYLRTLMHSKLE